MVALSSYFRDEYDPHKDGLIQVQTLEVDPDGITREHYHIFHYRLSNDTTRDTCVLLHIKRWLTKFGVIGRKVYLDLVKVLKPHFRSLGIPL